MVTLSELHIETYDKKDGTQGVSLVARVTEIELTQRAEQKPKPVTAETFAEMDDDIDWK